MAGLKPRPYQAGQLDAIEAAWEGRQRGTGVGVVRRAAVVAATGTGKTVTFAHLATEPRFDVGGRTLVLVHRDELAKQARDKIHSVDPTKKIGIVKAGDNEVAAEIVVASVQTLARQSRREQILNVRKIIADECHHAVARTWMDTLRHYGAFETEGTRTVGFTATMGRNDRLGLGDVWQEIVHRYDIIDAIRDGYLVDVKGLRIQIQGLDLGDVKRSGGDYADGDLGQHLEDAGAPEQVATAYLKHAGAQQGIVFWPTVQTAYDGAEAMLAAGIACGVVEGTTPIPTREHIYSKFRSGDLQVISNCGVLTEGFDAPWASVCAIARPTQSASLYIQMAGRVLRPWKGKDGALVLDFVGNATRHSLATLADLSPTVKREVKEGESLVEALQRQEDEDAQEERRQPARIVRQVATEVDLFASSTSCWLQTERGVWFVPTGKHLYFLWPEQGGTFTIGRTVPWVRKKAERVADGMTLEYAMRWAESLAVEEDPSIASRKSSWRRKAPPSPAQVGMATRYRIEYDEATTKSQLSDLISIKSASLALDR